MRSLLVLDFMLARAANVWVDDDLSLLQTRAVLQNGDLVSQPGMYVITNPEGPFGSATCNRNLLFSDSLDNVIKEQPSPSAPSPGNVPPAANANNIQDVCFGNGIRWVASCVPVPPILVPPETL